MFWTNEGRLLPLLPLLPRVAEMTCWLVREAGGWKGNKEGVFRFTRGGLNCPLIDRLSHPRWFRCSSVSQVFIAWDHLSVGVEIILLFHCCSDFFGGCTHFSLPDAAKLSSFIAEIRL